VVSRVSKFLGLSGSMFMGFKSSGFLALRISRFFEIKVSRIQKGGGFEVSKDLVL
jgi:hypothetical protein